MTNPNPVSGNTPALPDLAQIHTQAIFLHGLCQAADILHGNPEVAARNGHSAVLHIMTGLARNLADDLEAHL